jgi:hypothetical protein
VLEAEYFLGEPEVIVSVEIPEPTLVLITTAALDGRAPASRCSRDQDLDRPISITH